MPESLGYFLMSWLDPSLFGILAILRLRGEASAPLPPAR